tara:strand:+ start:11 stop:247 length:237 start_codon:yes stop_codon:yes gene_type:complete
MATTSNYKTFAQLGRELVLRSLIEALKKHGDFYKAYQEACEKHGMSDSTVRGAISTKIILKEYNKRYSRQLNLIATSA